MTITLDIRPEVQSELARLGGPSGPRDRVTPKRLA
jgi:hypothetical protein